MRIIQTVNDYYKIGFYVLNIQGRALLSIMWFKKLKMLAINVLYIIKLIIGE